LIEFGASIGVLPLDMPESVLVRFSGTMQTGITLRDLVNAIPYVAIQQGLHRAQQKVNKGYTGHSMIRHCRIMLCPV
jgi:aconitate hydratase 2/2-methylisocitrate dehydratase